MVNQDKRRVVGETVHAKACRVTNLAECARRYGVKSKTKEVVGVVVSVEYTPTANRNSNRRNCMVTGDFQLGGGVVKRKMLNVRSVKAGEPPGQEQQQENSENSQTAPPVPAT